MPDYDKPLTQEEKQRIIDRHHYLVDKMNETLGGIRKYEDEAILRKLDDPKEIAIYRMNEEYKRRTAERNTILASLKSKYGENRVRNNPFGRIFVYSLRLGKDPKDIAYNEKIYQEYINSPDKLAYREYDKLFKLDATEVNRLGNDREAQAYFYMEHDALCEQGYTINGVLDSGVIDSSATLKTALAGLKKPFEAFNGYGNIVKHNGVDYYACPTLDPTQAAMAMTNAELFRGNPNPELTEVINGKMGMNLLDTPNTFIEKLKNYGLDVNDRDLFLNYKVVRTDPNTGERKEVSFDKIFVEDDPNVRVERRSKEEIFQIRSINKVFQNKYVRSFQDRISSKLNQLVFDINQIEDEHKGGWMERNILHSTSPEWTAFIETFKQFNDPSHVNYGRKDILKEKAEAYRQHKRDQGYENLTDMKGTALKRSTLCQAVIDTCNVMEKLDDSIKEDIDIEIKTGLRGKVGLIINANEVDIFGDNANENNKEKSNDYDLDLVEENDDLNLSM